MKKIYLINQLIFIITLILYLTIVLGLYAQIILGIFQVLSSLLLIFHWKTFSYKTKKLLQTYWLIIIIYGFMWLFDWKIYNSPYVVIIGIMILPMMIAGYFLYIIHTIKKI